LRPGFHVIATARNRETLAQLTANGMTAVELDVTCAASITACRQTVGSLITQLDVLVNNA
jgi:1-acylglycerone phosphate reductase